MSERWEVIRKCDVCGDEHRGTGKLPTGWTVFELRIVDAGERARVRAELVRFVLCSDLACMTAFPLLSVFVEHPDPPVSSEDSVNRE